jgi:hypothetical protein
MFIAKDRKVLIRSLVLLGLPLLACCSPGPRDADSAQLPGPKPSAVFMSASVAEALRQHGGPPAAPEGPKVFEPTEDHVDDLACWRFPVFYRTLAPMGGEVLHHGVFWVKNGRIIRKQWDQ